MYNKASSRYKRIQNIKHGKCARCGGDLPADGGKICPECRKKNAEYIRKSRNSEKIAQSRLAALAEKFKKN